MGVTANRRSTTYPVKRSILALVLLAALSGCTREPAAPAPGGSTAASTAQSEYERLLRATKAKYPFNWLWRRRGSFIAIFDQLIADLLAAGVGASEAQKLACFSRAVAALNQLHKTNPSLIETPEAEALCELGNIVSRAAGLDPAKYGHGEGPISAGRDW